MWLDYVYHSFQLDFLLFAVWGDKSKYVIVLIFSNWGDQGSCWFCKKLLFSILYPFLHLYLATYLHCLLDCSHPLSIFIQYRQSLILGWNSFRNGRLELEQPKVNHLLCLWTSLGDQFLRRTRSILGEFNSCTLVFLIR